MRWIYSQDLPKHWSSSEESSKCQDQFILLMIIFFISALTVAITFFLIFCFAMSIQFAWGALEYNFISELFNKLAHCFCCEYDFFMHLKQHNDLLGSRLSVGIKIILSFIHFPFGTILFVKPISKTKEGII